MSNKKMRLDPCDNIEREEIMSLHSMHCGGSCMLKFHMKDGRISKVSSDGDIQRINSFDKDECLQPIQRRACLLGLSEKRQIYAPDRLKYPLIQTLERGNIRGFKRISWDEALDNVSGWYLEMVEKKKTLGYLPILDDGGVSQYLGIHLRRFGNPSSGNLRAAVFGAIGNYESLRGNPPIDVFNSNYIIIWGNDTPSTLPAHAFIVMKAKEAGIPITVVDTRHTDAVSTFCSAELGDLAHICVRPGTDAALIAAMCNVIYRRNLYDKNFISRYCFGFYPNDKVVSQSHAKHPVTKEPYEGKEFTLPPGASFVEYLDELEAEFGGYEGVLRWAENLTGVASNVIENFAMEYAKAKPAFVFSKLTGPQRTNNGMYFSWMLIALSAMVGYVNKRGGGYGDIRTDDGYTIHFEDHQNLSGTPVYSPILMASFKINDVLLNGRDGRTAEQLRDDVKTMNDIDLGCNAKLQLEMYVKGAGGGNLFNQTPNINRRLFAWDKLKHVVSYERFMSTTAAYSDIVLPTISSFEEKSFSTQTVSDTFVVNGPLDYMYEAKPDWWINEQIANRLGINIERRNASSIDIMKKQWESAKVPEEYISINPKFKLPEFDEIMKSGNLQLPVPIDKTVIQLATINPGGFDTDTGCINFYSPFYAERGRTALGINRAQYVMPTEGYENIMAGGKSGANGEEYNLQFITPHVANRALTSYGNIPVTDEQKPHCVEISIEDASARGIADQDQVYVFNDLGCMKITAKVTRRIINGVVCIGQGKTYRPSSNEMYQAYFDADGDGVPEPHIVPVDVGGCTNTITDDINSGVVDPFLRAESEPYFCGLGLNAGGALCQVSKTKPKGFCMKEVD